ncbi:MAG: hypothetical protein ACOYMA_06365 [Bacteroidia bacterium]
MENKVNTVITDAQVVAILTKIAELNGLITPFGITLNTEERLKLPKMGRNRVLFTEDALNAGAQYAEIKPRYGNTVDGLKDLAVCKQLDKVLYPLLSATQLLMDTRIQAGSEAYRVALQIYGEAGDAVKHKVPGIEPVYNHLKTQFESANKEKDPLEGTTK